MEIVEYKGDVERLRPLCEGWRAEADNSFDFSLSIDKFLAYLKLLAEENILLVALKENRPIGFMGLIAHESPLGDDVILHENFWYVTPNHRGMAGVRMFKAAREIGKERGCNKFSVTASYLANEEALRVETLYGKMGFELFESVFIKDLK